MQSDPKRYPLDPQELCGLMEDVFACGGDFRFMPTGTSMLPMLRERRDSVLLCSPAVRPVRKYDVILYRRDSGQAVLHRVIGLDGHGCFTLCGDRQTAPEYGIRQEQIVGVLTEFTRGQRRITVNHPVYRVYAKLWVASRPVRRFAMRAKRKLARLIKNRE